MAQTSVKEENKKAGAEKEIAVKMPQILLQPRVSEKAGHLTSLNKYVFNVLKGANKVEIKKAVERMYSVKVVRVNVLNTDGKIKASGRAKGKTSNFRKAVVTLKKGDTIQGVSEIV